MSIAATIAPHLPYLRRFARALSGSQAGGDAYVAAVLETLVADPSIFDNALMPRVALYRVLLRVWDRLSPEMSSTINGAPFERKLEGLTPRPRQAFLLTTVEGFSVPEAAEILDVSEPEVRALIDEAGREIARQVATDVLIIEDEPIIAMDLEALVESLGHRVTEVARTAREAVAAVERERPGLILADIQLADGSSGLDAVNEVLGSLNVPVIFITAYPERLLTGDRPEPAFLIMKPFQTDMVKAVISQALFFETRARPAERTALVG